MIGKIIMAFLAGWAGRTLLGALAFRSFRERYAAIKIVMSESVPKGAFIWALRAPRDLNKGDTVTLDIRDGLGRAYVALDEDAE